MIEDVKNINNETFQMPSILSKASKSRVKFLTASNDLEFDSEDYPDDISETETNNEESECEFEDDSILNLSSLELSSDQEMDETLIQLNALLRRLRTLVSVIQKSSNILQYVRKRQRESKLSGEIIKDFRIRWNYTNLFALRFLKSHNIINEITSNPSLIPGLTAKQMTKLKNLAISEMQWTMILALTESLNPFYLSTKILSGKKYQTMSKAYVMLTAIRSFLSLKETDLDDSEEFEHEYQKFKTDHYYTVINKFKVILSESLEFYTHKHISKEQNDAILVSKFI